LVGGHHLRRRLHVHRLLRASSPASDLRVLAIADSWRRHLGVRRRVRVLISDREAAPFTVGLLRPVIYLPSLVVADDRCLEPAIAHEMAHVARWDALWLGVERALAVLYFFHPLVHVAARRVDEARERLCDAEVVSRGRLARRAYAGGLVDVLRLDLKVAGMPTIGARKRRLAVRITDIMSRQRSDRASRATAFTTAALAGAFLLPLAGGTADSAAVSEPAAAAVIVSAHLQLDNPVPGSRVSWRWGPGRDPFNGKEVVHRGFDLAAEAGTAVRAPAEGTVVVATEDFEAEPAAGTVIIIDHGSGITTRYTHLGTLEVHQGQRVQRGDVIAGVGSTGRSTGPHVHFEVRVDDEPVDPADFVAEW
jgi:murein DD-endopeptidase MepM/ murein hydrolase activator NlpD